MGSNNHTYGMSITLVNLILKDIFERVHQTDLRMVEHLSLCLLTDSIENCHHLC